MYIIFCQTKNNEDIDHSGSLTIYAFVGFYKFDNSNDMRLHQILLLIQKRIKFWEWNIKMITFMINFFCPGNNERKLCMKIFFKKAFKQPIPNQVKLIQYIIENNKSENWILKYLLHILIKLTEYKMPAKIQAGFFAWYLSFLLLLHEV